jgi:hypothetical protein
VAVAVIPQLQKAKVKTTCVRIGDVATAANLYMMESNDCPSMDDLKADLQGEPEDSWGNEMKVECPSDEDVLIISAGRDGNFGTDDDLDRDSCRTVVKGEGEGD